MLSKTSDVGHIRFAVLVILLAGLGTLARAGGRPIQFVLAGWGGPPGLGQSASATLMSNTVEVVRTRFRRGQQSWQTPGAPYANASFSSVRDKGGVLRRVAAKGGTPAGVGAIVTPTAEEAPGPRGTAVNPDYPTSIDQASVPSSTIADASGGGTSITTYPGGGSSAGQGSGWPSAVPDGDVLLGKDL
jgi:hypothetical protein